ncbi:MAG: SPOR domain-containing protein [Polaromonas sp.]|uniref:SPOR domain-containing protein n=1 Tax=Polaromonas sp. TaxID=1869339 RepID=UPI00273479B9|nr:SPOR domain-containing protein [Polaromonas sp.]MDP3247818.1 SPOR domain-containing protein [Polaromonas sp.]
MAFFKFRWPGQVEQQAEKPVKRSRSSQAESIEVMRRRARHRLIGAAVLVLLGVVGFPLLFDTQPRPIPVDIPIEIPDRNKVAPLVVPAPVAEAPAAQPAASVMQGVANQRPAPARNANSAAGSGITDGEELLQGARPAASRPAPAVAAAPTTTAPKPEARPEPKPPVAPTPESRPVRPDDAARARALLEGGTADASAAGQAEEGRFIVQVGAFAEPDKAREARTKVERAGLKTYTQVVDTKDGKRTRVRVGPFTSRAEADKAAARIKSLDLSASVLTL